MAWTVIGVSSWESKEECIACDHQEDSPSSDFWPGVPMRNFDSVGLELGLL
jgi:hypothetical protein